MLEKLKSIVEKHSDLASQMANPDIYNNQEKLKEVAKEHSTLEPIVNKGVMYLSLLKEIDETKAILGEDDDELKQIAQEEYGDLKEKIENLEKELQILLLPKDPNDSKNLILEIRAGTGGDEAALFAADLYRIYTRFCERGAFGLLKYESGVHRVQRVPKTETSGRVHTSAATVAILPEAEDVDIDVNETDLKIDTYRASGAGGQHVNKTESAIRITHIPTGLVVTCQDESSQHKNRAAALKVLKSRLLASEQEKAAAERAAERKSLVSTGDRSAKIRTYNFPQGRVTDHRINFTSYKLNEIIDGDIDELIEKLKISEQETSLISNID